MMRWLSSWKDWQIEAEEYIASGEFRGGADAIHEVRPPGHHMPHMW
jgi:hypothetical protein